jgi:cell division protein FtsB
MQQRRTPGGQGPGARGGRDARGTGRRAAAGGRSTTRDPGVRGEPVRGARSGTRTSGIRTTVSRSGSAEAARSANRPAAATRRATTVGAAKRTRAPQPRKLTGRATVFCMLLIGLLLAYAYPVRVYLSQQAEIEALERSQAAQRAHINDLAGQLAKWNDDEYIKAQAKGRLLMVVPGEKPLIVVDQQPSNAKTSSGPAAGVPAANGPWYGKLWSSIKSADQGTS